ncbi:MAG TPA: universal stress protein [Trebonia sp.]|nr:universal stress protein [Trebonia sp.]
MPHVAPQSGEFELGTDGPSAILVGSDDTVTATRATAYAAGLARRQRARLIVVYVAPAGGPVAAAPGGAALLAAESAAYGELAASLRDRVEAIGRELGIAVTFIAAHGDPYGQIKRIADETRADAIVVGASMQAGHKLVGSLAVRLVRAGRWPVTVVP